MLDGVARKAMDPALNMLAHQLAIRHVTPNSVTLIAFVTGMGAAALIAGAFHPLAALSVLLLSRLADGLDGAVARASGTPTDVGGFLDIVLDFAFYGAIPLAFAVRDPSANGLAAAVLLFAFYVNGSSFLAFAAIAAKRGQDDAVRGPKALAFSVGLAEASETLLVFAAMIIWPAWFPLLAYGFALVCLLTAGVRIALAMRSFQ
ncbi:MAG: CDP-alcohol phosphatidyltransferase family protein [Beijerinckiaceae bacterium]